MEERADGVTAAALLTPDGATIMKQPDGPPLRGAILTTIPIFMGYSAMVVLQRNVKERIGFAESSREAYIFGVAVGFLYIGNLLFRLLHNIIFAFLRPRQRVMLSYTALTLAQLLIALPYFFFDSKSLVFAFFAYACAGTAIGTFESNLMSCITPLGHGTKSWAVLGIPIGFNGLSVGSFVLFAIWPGNVILEGSVYLFIAASNVMGLLYYVTFVPNIEFAASFATVRSFRSDLREWRQWFTLTKHHSFSLMVDMFCVSLFSSVVLYVYSAEHLPWYPHASSTMPKNAFQSVYYLFSFLGDFIGRKVAYMDKERVPYVFLICSVVGAGLVLSKVTFLAPFGIFLVLFANGSIYAHTTKFVDNHVTKKHNLIALSVWLFIGDIGSVVGSQITQPLRTAVGTVA